LAAVPVGLILKGDVNEQMRMLSGFSSVRILGFAANQMLIAGSDSDEMGKKRQKEERNL